MWEDIDVGTYRLRVPGGWIYKIWLDGEESTVVIFIAEPPVVMGPANLKHKNFNEL